jgi:hypothetical protein
VVLLAKVLPPAFTGKASPIASFCFRVVRMAGRHKENFCLARDFSRLGGTTVKT